MNEITQKKTKVDLLDILKNQKTAQKFLHYLTTNEVHNLMLCNKTYYNAFKDPKTYIYNKYMFKKYKDNYLFFYKYNINVKKLHQILEVIIYSDKIYKKLYHKIHIMTILFFFAGCILILDIFVLFVLLNKNVRNFEDFLPQIPLVIFWLLCVAIILSTSLLEQCAVNDIRENFRSKKIVKEGDELEKKILRNISKRLCNQKPKAFRPISYTYILCFIPVIIKYFYSTRYTTIFFYVSAIFCLVGFFYDFISFFYYKYSHRISKEVIYYNIYKDICPEYYYFKMNHIKPYDPFYNVSEVRLGFQYYFWLAIFHGAIIFYSYLVGRKLDNSKFGLSWRIILIPLYIICFIIVLWGILYIYSIKQHKSEYKWILEVTIIIIMICAIVNCVFWPNFYEKHKSVTRFFPIIIDGIITVTVIVHYFFLYKSKKKYENDDI
jgi:hypothetical protein